MSEIRGYYLTKIIDQRWAERFLDGEMYMRSLSHFGDFLGRPQDARNAYRGDLFEGTTTVTRAYESTFAKDAFGDTFPEDGVIAWTSEHLRTRRIFCLYCLEYSEESSSFVAPDARLREFGDTSVLIVNPIKFFRDSEIAFQSNLLR